MFLFTEEQARVGELLNIEIELPVGPLVMMVVVRNCSRRGGRLGIGVETYQLEDGAAARWRSFCISLGGDP